MLGYTQHDVLEVIQVADLAGVYAVTFLICVVNALLFEVLFETSVEHTWDDPTCRHDSVFVGWPTAKSFSAVARHSWRAMVHA